MPVLVGPDGTFEGWVRRDGHKETVDDNAAPTIGQEVVMITLSF